MPDAPNPSGPDPTSAPTDGAARLDLEFVPRPEPGHGRVFATRRRIRWGDTDPTGHLRLDAVARMLQDVANDDTRDAGLDPTEPWVVRRTALRIDSSPSTGDMVDLATWSGGHGRRWAERRTRLTGDGAGVIEAAALWVRIDRVTGVPARLDARFHQIYDEAAAGRRVGSRLRLPTPPEESSGSGQLNRRPWPLRHSDLDGLGHVNNAATWEPVVDEAARIGVRPVYAELEYGDGIGPDDEVQLLSRVGGSPGGPITLDVWLLVDGQVRATAHVRGG